MSVEDFFSSVARVFCSPLVLICAALLIIDHGRIAGPSLRAVRAAVHNIAYDSRGRASLVQASARPEITLRDNNSYSGGGVDLLGISSAKNWMQRSIQVLHE